MDRPAFRKRDPAASHLDQEVSYVVMGAEGYYRYEDTWRELPRQVGFLKYCGFILLGIDGINGFNVDEFMTTWSRKAA